MKINTFAQFILMTVVSTFSGVALASEAALAAPNTPVTAEATSVQKAPEPSSDKSKGFASFGLIPQQTMKSRSYQNRLFTKPPDFEDKKTGWGGLQFAFGVKPQFKESGWLGKLGIVFDPTHTVSLVGKMDEVGSVKFHLPVFADVGYKFWRIHGALGISYPLSYTIENVNYAVDPQVGVRISMGVEITESWSFEAFANSDQVKVRSKDDNFSEPFTAETETIGAMLVLAL